MRLLLQVPSIADLHAARHSTMHRSATKNFLEPAVNRAELENLCYKVVPTSFQTFWGPPRNPTVIGTLLKDIYKPSPFLFSFLTPLAKT